MTYICAQCGTNTKHFGLLLEHWPTEHPGVVR